MPNSAPIMTLAPELHLAIVEMLDFPDNVMLKLSNRYFHEVVKPLNFEQLVDGWRGEIREFQFQFLPCYDSHRLRPEAEFELIERYKRRGSCIECKVQKQREGYKIGDSIGVGDGHVLCRQCDEFEGAIPRRVEGLCQQCWELFEGQGYRFSLDDHENPATLSKEHPSKLRTSGAWLHHAVW